MTRITPTNVVMVRECPHRYNALQGVETLNDELMLGIAFSCFMENYGKGCTEQGVDFDAKLMEAAIEATIEDYRHDYPSATFKELLNLVRQFIKGWKWPLGAMSHRFESGMAVGIDADGNPVALRHSDDNVLASCIPDWVWMTQEGSDIVCRYLDHKVISPSRQILTGKSEKIPQYAAKRRKEDGDKPFFPKMPQDLQLRLSLPIIAVNAASATKFIVGHHYPRTGKIGWSTPLTRDEIFSSGVWEREILPEHQEMERREQEEDFPPTPCERCETCTFGANGDNSCPYIVASRENTATLLDGSQAKEFCEPAAASEPATASVPGPSQRTESSPATVIVDGNTVCGEEPQSEEEEMATPQPIQPAAKPPQAIAPEHRVAAVRPQERGEQDAPATARVVQRASWGIIPSRRSYKVYVWGGPGLYKTINMLEAFADGGLHAGQRQLCVSDLEGGTLPYLSDVERPDPDLWRFNVLFEPDTSPPKLVMDPRAIRKSLLDTPPGTKTIGIDSFTALCDLFREMWRETFLRREIGSKGHKGEYYSLQPKDYQLINADIQAFVFELIRQACNVYVTAQPKPIYQREGNNPIPQATDDEQADAWKRLAHYFDTVIEIERARPDLVIATCMQKDRNRLLPPPPLRFEWLPTTIRDAIEGKSITAFDTDGKPLRWDRGSTYQKTTHIMPEAPAAEPVTIDQLKAISFLRKQHGWGDEQYKKVLSDFGGVETAKSMTLADAARLIERLNMGPAPTEVPAAAPTPVQEETIRDQLLPGVDGDSKATPRTERDGDAELREQNSEGVIGEPEPDVTRDQLLRIKELKDQACDTHQQYELSIKAIRPGCLSAKMLSVREANALIQKLENMIAEKRRKSLASVRDDAASRVPEYDGLDDAPVEGGDEPEGDDEPDPAPAPSPAAPVVNSPAPTGGDVDPQKRDALKLIVLTKKQMNIADDTYQKCLGAFNVKTARDLSVVQIAQLQMMLESEGVPF